MRNSRWHIRQPSVEHHVLLLVVRLKFAQSANMRILSMMKCQIIMIDVTIYLMKVISKLLSAMNRHSLLFRLTKTLMMIKTVHLEWKMMRAKI